MGFAQDIVIVILAIMFGFPAPAIIHRDNPIPFKMRSDVVEIPHCAGQAAEAQNRAFVSGRIFVIEAQTV